MIASMLTRTWRAEEKRPGRLHHRASLWALCSYGDTHMVWCDLRGLGCLFGVVFFFMRKGFSWDRSDIVVTCRECPVLLRYSCSPFKAVCQFWRDFDGSQAFLTGAVQMGIVHLWDVSEMRKEGLWTLRAEWKRVVLREEVGQTGWAVDPTYCSHYKVKNGFKQQPGRLLMDTVSLLLSPQHVCSRQRIGTH